MAGIQSLSGLFKMASEPCNSTAEPRLDVPAAVHYVQNQHHVSLCDAINRKVMANREAAHPSSQILIPRTSSSASASSARRNSLMSAASVRLSDVQCRAV